MNSKIINTLEFNKVLNILKSFAITDLAKDEIDALVPSSNKLEIDRAQSETTEATSYLLKQHDIPLSPISNLDKIIAK